MSNVVRLSLCFLVVSFSVSMVGCDGDSPRVVEESDEFTFDEIAAQAAADTALSDEGE